VSGAQVGRPAASDECISRGVVGWRAAARRNRARPGERSAPRPGRRADWKPGSRFVARHHESLPRDQCARHDGPGRHTRSRVDSARRPARRDPRARTPGGGRLMRALQYAFEEARASLWRGRRSGLLSTITIALAILVLSGFLLVTSNLGRLGAGWSSAAELSVYLTDDVTAADRAAIEAVLASDPVVGARELVSKEDAVKRFKETFGDLSATLDGAGENPLPASYEVRVKAGLDSR